VRGYPAGQCSSGARCSVVFIRLLTWVFDEFVEPVVDLACVAVFHEPAKPIADVLEAVPCLVGGEWCSDTTLAK